jgi:hypothetical protein
MRVKGRSHEAQSYHHLYPGIAVAIIALSWGFFREYQPNTAEATMYNDRAAELEAVQAQMPQAEARVKNAEAMVEEKAAAWRRIVAVRTPPQGVNLGGISLAVNPFQLTVDTRKFRNSVQRAVNNQLKRGGVRVISGPLVPAPEPDESANRLLGTYYNYPAIAFPVVIFDLGQVVVQGTYRQITSHVRSYARMPRYLAVAMACGSTAHRPT